MPFDKLTAIESGRKGGNKTKERMLAKDPDYYKKTGRSGGEKLLKEKGIEYFRTIGKMKKGTKK